MSVDFPSRLDLLSIARLYVLSRATKIDPAQVDIEGSDVNLFVGISSVVGYQIVLALAQSVNSLLLDGAFDEDLDRYAFDRYQLTRKGAAAARGQVDLFRASLAGGAGFVSIGTPLLTLNGVEYVTSSTGVFSATTSKITVEVRASQAGKISQVGANQIRQFVSPSTLFDPTLQVNNPAATAGGEDPESDELFRERIRSFWLTARRGTASAIEFGAKTVDGITSAQAKEVMTADPKPARVVLLRVADSSGVASAALAHAALVALDEYRACGIAVVPEIGTPQLVSVALKLTFAGNVDTVTLADNIRAAVVEYVNSLGVGETLYRSELYSVLTRFKSAGLLVSQDTILAPTGDIVPSAGKTIRTTAAQVTV